MEQLFTWGTILQSVAIGLLLWLLKKVNYINGSIRELSQWKDEHVKLADERHSNTKNELSDLWRKING